MQRPPEGRALRGGQLFRQGVLLEEESSIFTLKARAALKRVDMDESERSELARKFALMADLDIHIKDVERVIKLDLKDNDDARLVDSLPGFGVILSRHGRTSLYGMSVGARASRGDAGRFIARLWSGADAPGRALHRPTLVRRGRAGGELARVPNGRAGR